MCPFVIRINKERTRNNMIGSGTVAAENYVLYTCQTGQCLYIRVVRLQGHRVSEEEKIIDLSVHNTRSHLLVTPQRT